MFYIYTSNPSKMLIALAGLATLSACGGGSDLDTGPAGQNAPIVVAASTQSSTSVDTGATTSVMSGMSRATASPTLLLTPTTLTPSSPAVAGTAITDLQFENTSAVTQTSVPVTFGQVFAKGAVSATAALCGKLADGTLVPLQLDIKARHDDGSLRHAVISAVLPSLVAGKLSALTLVVTNPYANTLAASPSGLLSAGFSAAANITLAGKAYTASADTLLKSGKFTTWLAGPIVNEWHVSAPLTNAAGVAHPHLTARFAIRSYTGSKKTRVDVTIENNWAYEPAPQNFTYDAQIVVGGTPVYTKAALTHTHHARWRKLFWWGGEPQVHVRHNGAYLMQTRAVPNYDRSIVVPETRLAAMKTAFTGTKTEPMGVGAALPAMSSGGARYDIGLLPGWAVTYLLTGDKRAADVTNKTADLAGSWAIHYRNRNTDRPVSLIDFPYMTIKGTKSSTMNPVTKQYESFPACATTTACKQTAWADTAHQPSFAYLPYALTGDHYYLEEMQFWAMYNLFSSNPGYRDNVKGLLKAGEVRSQAWGLRTLSQAAFITPDADPLKAQFTYFLNNNLDYYNTTYTDNAGANSLGIIINGTAVVYDDSTGIAPWQDDFFTAAVGLSAELGAAKAHPLLAYKSKFPISRMTDAGGCWIFGAMYKMKVRDSKSSAIYGSFSQVYGASQTDQFKPMVCASVEMAAALKLKVGEMTGYATSATGYPANMQPALAYSAGTGTAGLAAWTVFNKRTTKPNHEAAAQFAIVPR